MIQEGLALAAGRLGEGGVFVSNTIDETRQVTRALRGLFRWLVAVRHDEYENTVLAASRRPLSGQEVRALAARHPVLRSHLRAFSFRTLVRGRAAFLFVRAALRRALDELAEARMAEAYKAKPDVEPAHFDPRVWESDETGADRSGSGDRAIEIWWASLPPRSVAASAPALAGLSLHRAQQGGRSRGATRGARRGRPRENTEDMISLRIERAADALSPEEQERLIVSVATRQREHVVALFAANARARAGRHAWTAEDASELQA